MVCFNCNQCGQHSSANIYSFSNIAVCSHHDSQGLEGGTSDAVWARYVNAAVCKWVPIKQSRSWSNVSPVQRIDCLLKLEHFPEALSLAWSFHEGTAKAVVGECNACSRHFSGQVNEQVSTHDLLSHRSWNVGLLVWLTVVKTPLNNKGFPYCRSVWRSSEKKRGRCWQGGNRKEWLCLTEYFYCKCD